VQRVGQGVVKSRFSRPFRREEPSTFRVCEGLLQRAGDMMVGKVSVKWLTGRPVLAMMLVWTVMLVVGVGAGFKIEQSRTRSDVSRLKARVARIQSPTTKAVVKRSGVLNERVGVVSALASGSFSVETKKHRTFQVATTGATAFGQAGSGSKADIRVGTRVLVTSSRSGVIVVPQGSLFGRTVTSVTSASFTITKANGSSTKVSFAKVKVINTTSTVQSAALKNGAEVMVSGQGSSSGKFDAVQVILLPAGSAFTN